jgi:hypothetical protein
MTSIRTAGSGSARKSLPLSAQDLADLERLRRSASHRDALSLLVDVEIAANASEASLLHAVLEAGLRAVREQVEAQGYAQMAGEIDASPRRSSARRRRPTWADE